MSNDNTSALKYPPLPPAELKDAHSYENIERVVITQNGVYGLVRDGGWIKFEPLASLSREGGET